MCNCLSKYLIEKKIIYSKQFGFQGSHSTNHAMMQFVDQILESCENIEQILGTFITLSKDFDIVNHSILLKIGSRATSKIRVNSRKLIKREKLTGSQMWCSTRLNFSKQLNPSI